MISPLMRHSYVQMGWGVGGRELGEEAIRSAGFEVRRMVECVSTL